MSESAVQCIFFYCKQIEISRHISSWLGDLFYPGNKKIKMLIKIWNL